MVITYTWKLTGLTITNTDNLADVVVNARWQKIGTDDLGNYGTFSGATPFSYNQIDPNNFINYKNLNEETVLSWVKSVVKGEYEKHVNEQIEKQITAKKTTVVDADNFPWIPAKS